MGTGGLDTKEAMEKQGEVDRLPTPRKVFQVTLIAAMNPGRGCMTIRARGRRRLRNGHQEKGVIALMEVLNGKIGKKGCKKIVYHVMRSAFKKEKGNCVISSYYIIFSFTQSEGEPFWSKKRFAKISAI